MSIRVIIAATFAGVFATGAGCDNTHCEEGAVCLDGEETEELRADECLMYCARLSTCDAPQADDFERCVKHCQKRFREAPRETAELCACAEWSRCEDLVQGRCSPHPGAGGSGGQGAGGHGGQASGGTAGSTCGGTAGSGGAGAAGGTSGSGANAGTGPDAGVAGSAGTGSPPACTRDCDCPLPDFCRGGVCVPPEAAD